MNSTNRIYFWMLFWTVIFVAVAFTWATKSAMAHDGEIPAYIQIHLNDVVADAEKKGDLARFDRMDLNSIVALLDHNNHRVASAAAYALGEIRNSEAVPALVSALVSDHAHMRRIAAHALGKIGDPRAVLPLIEILRDKTQPLAVQTSVIMSLGKIGDPKARWIIAELNHSPRKWLQQTTNIALLKLNAKQSTRIAAAK